MEKIAVLIPCYNENKTIAKVIKDFLKVLPTAQIYVYDNNSTDNTDEIARQNGAIVRYEHRQGKGNVIRTMFHDIQADAYIMVDGDDTYPAEYAEKMIDLVLNDNVDMVIGDRLSSTYFTENKRLFHNGGNILVRKLVNNFFHGNITDIMTGYRAFSHAFVKSFPVLSAGFEIETEMTIHALDKRFSIATIPVTYRDRPVGSTSKLNTFSDGFKVINTIIHLYKDYRPFSFFRMLSFLLCIVALILFIPILVEYQATHMVPRFPTLIISGFAMLASIQLFICGLILEANVKKERQDFEIQLNITKQLKYLYDKG